MRTRGETVSFPHKVLLRVALWPTESYARLVHRADRPPTLRNSGFLYLADKSDVQLGLSRFRDDVPPLRVRRSRMAPDRGWYAPHQRRFGQKFAPSRHPSPAQRRLIVCNLLDS